MEFCPLCTLRKALPGGVESGEFSTSEGTTKPTPERAVQRFEHRALGVKGHEAELRSASNEFSGHCFALTLLGSYLTDAYNGDIRRRSKLKQRIIGGKRFSARFRLRTSTNW